MKLADNTLSLNKSRLFSNRSDKSLGKSILHLTGFYRETKCFSSTPTQFCRSQTMGTEWDSRCTWFAFVVILQNEENVDPQVGLTKINKLCTNANTAPRHANLPLKEKRPHPVWAGAASAMFKSPMNFVCSQSAVQCARGWRSEILVFIFHIETDHSGSSYKSQQLPVVVSPPKLNVALTRKASRRTIQFNAL